MAHHKDALKRIRQTQKRTARNRAIRTFYRNEIKKVRAAVAAGDKAQAENALRPALRAIDRAVSHRVLHRNTALRYKSRLSRAVAALGAGSTSTAA